MDTISKRTSDKRNQNCCCIKIFIADSDQHSPKIHCFNPLEQWETVKYPAQFANVCLSSIFVLNIAGPDPGSTWSQATYDLWGKEGQQINGKMLT
jgi:hypothetical protein